MRQFWEETKAHIYKWLCNHSRKFKFKQICKAVGITPYWWQKDYALSKNPILVVSGGRRSGKTMAVMLRALMYEGERHTRMSDFFEDDPDYTPLLMRQKWYFDEYEKLYNTCQDYGIPVTYIFDYKRLSV